MPTGLRELAEIFASTTASKIEVPLSRFGTPTWRWLRISAQIYNSPAEYEYLAEALRTL
jgi:selenocysteine lyase/cysteine desulfurase